jgi:hypothetical protein
MVGSRGIIDFSPLLTPGGRLRATHGPIGKSIEDLLIGMKVLLHP